MDFLQPWRQSVQLFFVVENEYETSREISYSPYRAKVLFFCFWLLGTIERTTLSSFIDTLTVEDSTYDVVSYTWEIFHTTTTDHDYWVLLEIVPFSSDVWDNFVSIRQTNFGNFSESWVWLLRSTRVHLETDSSTLRRCEWTHFFAQTVLVELKSWGFTFLCCVFSFTTNELIDSRHDI